MERKLAAILALDVVGYAGRVARDEDAALAEIERLGEDIVRLQVEANRGRLFKSMGDGFLAEFSSTIEAVNCAIGIQHAVAADARASDGSEPLLVRIGVSLGDVVVRGSDRLGQGVNTAARLEAMAEPGGIAVSGEVMAQIRGKTDLVLEDCGHKRLKDSDTPIHVYMTRANPVQAGGFLDDEEAALRRHVITGGCLCGNVRYEIRAPAISTGYCHCRICQKFTGSSMSTWTAFPLSAVAFLDAEPRYFASSEIAERGFCPDCGANLTYRLLKPRPGAVLVIFTSSLDAPEGYAPAIHSGIESQMAWIDLLDDLPRTRSEESRVLQEAWSSVGHADPATWVPLTKPRGKG